MGKLAFLFAGQGAQAAGMGKSLYEAGGAAREVLDMAEALRPGTAADCFEGGAERLAVTEVTQPCVFAVDLAAAEALREAGVAPDGAAGFSLGELAALTFAGAFERGAGFSLVCARGRRMQAAAVQNPGVMAAVLKLSDGRVRELCADFGSVWPVNFNCEGQVTVAGAAQEMPALCAAVKAAGGLARTLAVGGAFHSPFMEEAAELFLGDIEKAGMRAPGMPVYANLSAQPYGEECGRTLARQMCSSVLWSESVLRMARDGYDTFVEVGPGRTLTGLVKRILPGARLFSVQDADGVRDTARALAM